MLTHPNFDPVALSIPEFSLLGLDIGPINVHWYGIMYLCGFSAAWILGMYRAKQSWTPVVRRQIEDMIFYAAIGVVAGGRLGYVLFYGFSDFLEDPLWLFKLWDGGMSFHGGMIGVMVAMAYYCRKLNKNFVDIMDFGVVLAPLGMGFGRFGNFIGQELWGRETDVSWGMVFPKDPEALARHPSQLYQVFLEGIVLFSVLWWFSRKPRPRGVISGLFLVIYGLGRFIVEFVREPDAHLQFVAFEWMTRGQQLSLPMIIFGGLLIYWGYTHPRFAPAEVEEKNNDKVEAKEKKETKENKETKDKEKKNRKKKNK